MGAPVHPEWGPLPRMHGRGLTLTPFAEDDAPFLAALSLDAELAKWFDWSIHLVDDEALLDHNRAVVARWHREYAEGRTCPGRCGRTPTPRPAGTVELQIQRGGWAEISYATVRERRGHGLATSAVTLACAWAFDLGGLDRVVIVHDVANMASRRVAEKAGFAFVEIREQGETYERFEPWVGRRHDQAVHELRRDVFFAGREPDA